jgi:hypothetical protein
MDIRELSDTVLASTLFAAQNEVDALDREIKRRKSRSWTASFVPRTVFNKGGSGLTAVLVEFTTPIHADMSEAVDFAIEAGAKQLGNAPDYKLWWLRNDGDA